MTLSTSKKWGRLARVARDRNPRWAVGRLLDKRLRFLGLTPAELEERTGIARSNISHAMAGGQMSATNLAVLRRELGIPFEELETALLADFIPRAAAREVAEDLRDQLQDLVDDLDPDDEEESDSDG